MLAIVVTSNIAAGGMKGVTFVQALQYWIKLVAIAVPAVVLLAVVGGVHRQSLTRPVPPVFATTTTVHVQTSVDINVVTPVTVTAEGTIDGVQVDGPLTLSAGKYEIKDGAVLVFPAGAADPPRDRIAHPGRQILGVAVRRRWASRSTPAGGDVLADRRDFPWHVGVAAHPGALLHQPRRSRCTPDNGHRVDALGELLSCSRPCSPCSADSVIRAST